MFETRSPDEEYLYFVSEQTNGSLFLAWRRLNTSQILDTKDHLGLRILSAQTVGHIATLARDLTASKYRPDPPSFVYAPKDNGLFRIRTFLTIRDRLAYQALGNIIIENSYADIANYANKTIFAHIPAPKKRDGSYNEFTFLAPFNRSRIGIKAQWERFLDAVHSDTKEFSRESDICMIETDITSFYPSIDHNLIREMLERRKWLKDPRLIDLLMLCLGTWSTFDSNGSIGQGVPIGYETSELIATLFLLDIDMSLELPTRVKRMRRFVDDAYFFIEGKNEANRFVAEYDLALQRRGLTLNSAKTAIRRCDKEVDEAEIRRNLRRKLSFIKYAAFDEDNDWEPDSLLLEVLQREGCCTGQCDEPDIQCIQENASTIAFVLYRLKTLDQKAKQIAFCVLREVPSRSFHATAYLSRFGEDGEVWDELWSHINSPGSGTILRIDCVKAILALSRGIFDALVDVLCNWISTSDDWYLRQASIGLLEENLPVCGSEWVLNTVRSASINDVSVFVRAKAFSALFQWLNERDSRIEQLRAAFADPTYTINSLGVYFFRRFSDVSLADFVEGIAPEIGVLLQADRLDDDRQEFLSRFAKLFGFEISDTAPFLYYLPNLQVASQQLLDALDSSSDHLSLVKAFYKVVLQFYAAVVRSTDNRFAAQSLIDIPDGIYDDNSDEKNLLRDLHIFYERAQKGTRGSQNSYSKTIELIEKVKTLIAVRVIQQYYASQLEPSASLQESASKMGSVKKRVRDKIFICYASSPPKLN